VIKCALSAYLAEWLFEIFIIIRVALDVSAFLFGVKKKGSNHFQLGRFSNEFGRASLNQSRIFAEAVDLERKPLLFGAWQRFLWIGVGSFRSQVES